MTAAILAGGQGTRFGGDTKVLTPIGNQPFIRYVVDNLKANGVDNVYICGGRRTGLLLDELWRDVQGYSIAWDLPLGTGGAVKALLSALPPTVDDILVINGDTCFKCDFSTVVTAPTMIVTFGKGNVDCAGDYVFHYSKEGTKSPYTDCGGLYRRADFDDTPTTFDMEVVIKRLVAKSELHWFWVNGPVHHISTKAGFKAARRYYGIHKRLP